TLSPAVTVTDTGSSTLVSATVAVSGGTFANDGDVLAAMGTASISVSYNSTTETLTLSGSDTLADYQSVLDTVTFVTPSDNPTDYGSDPTRTLIWTVDDGIATGTAPTTVGIVNVNDPPTLSSVAPSATVTE